MLAGYDCHIDSKVLCPGMEVRQLASMTGCYRHLEWVLWFEEPQPWKELSDLHKFSPGNSVHEFLGLQKAFTNAYAQTLQYTLAKWQQVH